MALATCIFSHKHVTFQLFTQISGASLFLQARTACLPGLSWECRLVAGSCVRNTSSQASLREQGSRRGGTRDRRSAVTPSVTKPTGTGSKSAHPPLTPLLRQQLLPANSTRWPGLCQDTPGKGKEPPMNKSPGPEKWQFPWPSLAQRRECGTIM